MTDPSGTTFEGGYPALPTQLVDKTTEESATTAKSTPAYERETTIISNDEDDVIVIWTMQRRFISRMRKHPAFRETGSGYHGASEWAEFQVPSKDWNPASGGKRKRDLTPEQRQAMADRLAQSRRKER